MWALWKSSYRVYSGAPDLNAVSNADGNCAGSYMNEDEVWCSLTRSRRTDFGSRFVFVGLEGPAWDDEARIWVVGDGKRWLARRVRVVGFIICVSMDGTASRLSDS
jgi:hypothetical protein